MTKYTFHSNFIFRTPQLPVQKNSIGVSDLFNYSKQSFFKEAIYIASPVLHDELLKWHNRELMDTKGALESRENKMKFFFATI